MNISRKKIRRSKELLNKKNSNLKQYYLNSLYNKEILIVLEKVEECNDLFVQIDSLLKSESYFEVTILIYTLRKKIQEFDTKLKDCTVIKHLTDNENYRTRSVENLIKKFLKSYVFLLENEFTFKLVKKAKIGNTFNFDRVDIEANSIKDSVKFEQLFNKDKEIIEESIENILLTRYGLNIDQLGYFEQKVSQMKVIIQLKPKDWVDDPVDTLLEYLIDSNALDNGPLIKFISKCYPKTTSLNHN